MTGKDPEILNLQDAVRDLHSELSNLQIRLAGLESIQPAKKGKRRKKAKKLKKVRKNGNGMDQLIEQIRQMSHEELAAIILKFHKNPLHIANKLARERLK